MRVIALLLGCLVMLAGCGSEPTPAAPPSPQTATEPATARPEVAVLSAGFAQVDDALYGAVVVVTDDTSAIGELVTARLSFYTESGQLVANTNATAPVHWKGQHLVIGKRIELEEAEHRVNELQPHVVISHTGNSAKAKPAWKAAHSRQISATTPGHMSVEFEIVNDTDADASDLMIPVVCLDKDNQIVGGGETQLEFLGEAQSAQVTVEVLADPKPVLCEAYPTYLEDF